MLYQCGTKILALDNGKVTYVGFNGANGYTVIISYENGLKSTYGHVDPNFLVSKGQEVIKGQAVAKVGPKYVEKKPYTIYTDNTGKPTNGATTGPHLHFAISINGNKVDPSLLF